MEEPSSKLLLDTRFLLFLGMFHGAWSSIDLVTACGIGKFLGISHEETHILTAGMEFGRKAQLLRNLVYRSNHAKRNELLGVIGKLQNSKRNVFAHAIIISDEKTVTFIDRARGGDYKVEKHPFTLEEFSAYVESLTLWGKELTLSLEVSRQEQHDFALAAISAVTKSRKSPTPPNDKA